MTAEAPCPSGGCGAMSQSDEEPQRRKSRNKKGSEQSTHGRSSTPQPYLRHVDAVRVEQVGGRKNPHRHARQARQAAGGGKQHFSQHSRARKERKECLSSAARGCPCRLLVVVLGACLWLSHDSDTAG